MLLDDLLSKRTTIASAALARQGGTMGSLARQLAFAVVSTCGLSVIWSEVPTPFLPAAVPVAVLGLILAAIRPALVSTLFLWLTCFKLNEISPALAALGYLLTLGLALTSFTLIWHLIFARSISLDFRGPHALVGIFWLCASCGVLVAQDHSMALGAWSEYSKTLLLAIAILWFVRAKAQSRLLVCLFVIGGSIISLCTAANAWTGAGLVEGTRAVVGEATLSNPNDLVPILPLPLAFSAMLVIVKNKSVDGMIGLAGVVLIGYAIVLTQSRGGLLGVTAVVAIIGGRYIISKLLLAGVGVLFALMLYDAMGISGRESGGDSDANGESAQDRIYAWQAGVNMAKAFPLTGVGIGNFAAQFSNYTPEEVQHPLTSHKIWFLVLGEIGIPRLMLFVGLLFCCIRTGAITITSSVSFGASPAQQDYALATFAALGAYLVSGSFFSYAFQWPLYVLVTLIVALARLAGAQRQRVSAASSTNSAPSSSVEHKSPFSHEVE